MNTSPQRRVKMFSWEKPIEDTILDFCEDMYREMSNQALRFSGFFEGKQRAKTEGYADAYRTVARKIKEEIKLRENLTTKEGEE